LNNKAFDLCYFSVLLQQVYAMLLLWGSADFVVSRMYQKI